VSFKSLTEGGARLVGDGCQLNRRHCQTVGASRTERSAARQVGDVIQVQFEKCSKWKNRKVAHCVLQLVSKASPVQFNFVTLYTPQHALYFLVLIYDGSILLFRVDIVVVVLIHRRQFFFIPTFN